MYGQAAGTRAQDATLHEPADLDVTVDAQPQFLPLLRESARAFAVRCGITRPDDVRLAIAEACMNAVRHAYPEGAPGTVRLHGTTDWREVTFTVEDRGSGPVPKPLETRTLGLGLPVIARVCDHWSVGDADGVGVRVRMVFAR